MKKTALSQITNFLCFCLLAFGFLTSFNAKAAISKPILEVDEPVLLVEVQYEKLMRSYVNKIKHAFSETDDAKALAILNQYMAEFNLKSAELKKQIAAMADDMNPRDKEKLYMRLNQRSHIDELMALMFDERITTRMAANGEIKYIMDELYAKSLELNKADRTLIAAGK